MALKALKKKKKSVTEGGVKIGLRYTFRNFSFFLGDFGGKKFLLAQCGPNML